MKRNLVLFEKANLKIDENPRLRQIVDNYYESDNKLLPVIITGSNTSYLRHFYWHYRERFLLMAC